MNSHLFYIVSLVIVFNCVISVAKNDDQKVVKSSANTTDEAPVKIDHQIQTPEIFAEGGSSSNTTPKNRIVGRKGAVPDVVVEALTPITSRNSTQSTTSKIITSNVPTSSNTTTIKTSVTSSNFTTVQPRTNSSTVKTTTTTKKPILKPKVTYSADDNPEIIKNEKNINYNATTKMDDISVPKTSSDIDRTIIDEEKKTRNSYIFFMGLLFGVPMTFTIVHVLYKKIKAWREIRHYQRVVSSNFALFSLIFNSFFSFDFKDFLIDGMYIS